MLRDLFSTELYVRKEIEYSYVSTRGYLNQSALENWREYLEKYRDFIVSGTHFINFAVQVGRCQWRAVHQRTRPTPGRPFLQ